LNFAESLLGKSKQNSRTKTNPFKSSKGFILEKSKTNVLIAENNPEGSFFWERIITESQYADIEFIHIENLSDILKYLENETPDVILLDLSLPEGGGFEVFLLVYNKAPAIPIILVTGSDNQKLSVQATLEGAQDSLNINDITAYSLNRSMRYAIGRQKHLRQERALSASDELTGLCNRRGFLMRAEEQIKLSDRTGQPLFLVFADVDGLKAINDNIGHHSGDIAIMETACVLREAFRESDILGRLSGDEFVALLTDANDIKEEALTKRFQETLDEHNRYPSRSFQLSASIGIASYNPRTPCSIGDLLAKADSLMYKKKKVKKDFGQLQVFAEIKDPVQSVLAESLAETRNEAIVKLMIPILRKCGVDAGLSLQLSSWVAKGSPELKLSLIKMIEDIGGASGGPALRMGLLDDSEEVATLAARVIGKIHLTSCLPALLRVSKLREKWFPEDEMFLTAVCQSLGDLAQPEGSSFLREIAGNKYSTIGKSFSLLLRLEAVEAMIKINEPETLSFLKNLIKEDNPELQDALQKITNHTHPV
jgi:two-component system cell cycle response regulator